MTLTNAMTLVDQTAVPLALPNIMQDFHVGTQQVQWVMNASLLPLAGLLVLGGRLVSVLCLVALVLMILLIRKPPGAPEPAETTPAASRAGAGRDTDLEVRHGERWGAPGSRCGRQSSCIPIQAVKMAHKQKIGHD